MIAIILMRCIIIIMELNLRGSVNPGYIPCTPPKAIYTHAHMTYSEGLESKRVRARTAVCGATAPRAGKDWRHQVALAIHFLKVSYKKAVQTVSVQLRRRKSSPTWTQPRSKNRELTLG